MNLDYYVMTDKDRMQAAKQLLLTGEVNEEAGEFLRCAWQGNYLRMGNPLIHHPIMQPLQDNLSKLLEPFKAVFTSKEDQQVLDSLPNTFTIYRGRDNTGFSWSLSEDVAASFGDVYSKQVSKEHVFGYINDRQEQEIIYFGG